MSEHSDTWITESDTTTQTAASALAIVVGLILAIGFRGFDRAGFTQGLAVFLLGVVMLIVGAGLLLFGGRQVITVDPRQRRIAIERISRFRTATRVIPLDTVADFCVAEHGDHEGGSVRYHVKAKLKAGGEVALFVGFFDGSRSRLAMEKRCDRLLQCLRPER
jgi:hypothetical protein